MSSDGAFGVHRRVARDQCHRRRMARGNAQLMNQGFVPLEDWRGTANDRATQAKRLGGQHGICTRDSNVNLVSVERMIKKCVIRGQPFALL